MKTLFDLVGKFRQLVANKDGKPGNHLEGTTKILVGDMSPEQCSHGTQVLQYIALNAAKQYIEPGKCWLEDWELREKKVNEEKEVA